MPSGPDTSFTECPLGQQGGYRDNYTPELLFQVSRQPKRDEINVGSQLPFYGEDIWNGYELSWLNRKGKPIVSLITITVPCDSPNIFESKSLKLYFNSFNQTHFDSPKQVQTTIQQDLSHITGKPVTVQLTTPEKAQQQPINNFAGLLLDELDISCDTYQVNPEFLITDDGISDECLYSNLLKSNCLVTNQPDWGSIQICYRGKTINHAGLLKYIVSFRHHNEFHEQCVERIFMDIQRRCQPEHLTVYARYTRRGGIDINPIRSSAPIHDTMNDRQARQ